MVSTPYGLRDCREPRIRTNHHKGLGIRAMTILNKWRFRRESEVFTQQRKPELGLLYGWDFDQVSTCAFCCRWVCFPSRGPSRGYAVFFSRLCFLKVYLDHSTLETLRTGNSFPIWAVEWNCYFHKGCAVLVKKFTLLQEVNQSLELFGQLQNICKSFLRFQSNPCSLGEGTRGMLLHHRWEFVSFTVRCNF